MHSRWIELDGDRRVNLDNVTYIAFHDEDRATIYLMTGDDVVAEGESVIKSLKVATSA